MLHIHWFFLGQTLSLEHLKVDTRTGLPVSCNAQLVGHVTGQQVDFNMNKVIHLKTSEFCGFEGLWNEDNVKAGIIASDHG